MGKGISRHFVVWAIGNLTSLYLAQKLSAALEPDPNFDTPLNGLNNKRVAGFLFLYYTVMVISRLKACGSYVMLEMLWGCNVSMLQAVMGVATNQPLVVGSAVTTIAIDQLCWYVDLLGYALTKKFPVGVAKYLIRPETGKVKFLTSFHHLWFIPTIMWMLRNHGGVRPGSWSITCGVTAFLAVFCRMFTPHSYNTATRCAVPKSRSHRDIVEINVNLCHEFYEDIKLPILHICNDKHPALYLPFLVLVCNVVLNGPPYLLLRRFSTVFL